MQRTTFCTAVLAASLSVTAATAQTGNEVIFVGSSTSGSADQHVFAESATGGVLVSDGVGFTDNVTGAVWADQGRRLYVGQGLMDQVSVADWNGSTATWSTFYAGTGSCYGVELDAVRKLVWTLTPNASGFQQLTGLDADVASATYGQVVAQTSTLFGMRERWGLSMSGKLAAVPLALLQSGTLDVVDLDPSSPTYLQVIVSTQVPGANNISLASDVEISADDAYVYVLYAGVNLSAIAVWDLAAGAFLDFGAGIGQQDFQLPLTVPNLMDLSVDRSFAVVSGQGGAGWAGRVDFDYANPVNSTFTEWSTLTLPNANGISLSPEGTRAAVTSTATNLQAPSKLTIVDVMSGAELQSVTLSAMWNVYTTAWQDASPVAPYELYGAGCAGGLGAPTLAPQAGSRPALGTGFTLEVGNLPFNGALVATGLSNTQTGGGLPLPLDLSLIGMTGCTQYVDAQVLEFVVGAGNQASWTWQIPNVPALFGAQFYNQAFAFDPAANSFGWTASNAGGGALGF